MNTRTPRHPAACHARAGLTLPETLLAIGILAFATAALSHAVTAGQQISYHALHEVRGLSLAEAMMDEVLSKPYTDPDGDELAGPDTGELSRADYDCMDDFDGYTSADAGVVADAAGVSYPNSFQRFTRTVTAAYVTTSVADLGGQDQSGLLITVSVTDTKGRNWSLHRFVAEPVNSGATGGGE